eukprot:1430456-Pleurochrysis_carterae.AAC.2
MVSTARTIAKSSPFSRTCVETGVLVRLRARVGVGFKPICIRCSCHPDQLQLIGSNCRFEPNAPAGSPHKSHCEDRQNAVSLKPRSVSLQTALNYYLPPCFGRPIHD